MASWERWLAGVGIRVSLLAGSPVIRAGFVRKAACTDPIVRRIDVRFGQITNIPAPASCSKPFRVRKAEVRRSVLNREVRLRGAASGGVFNEQALEDRPAWRVDRSRGGQSGLRPAPAQ